MSNKELCKINTSWSHCTDLNYLSFFLHLSYNSSSKTGSAASSPLAAHCMEDLNSHFFQAGSACQAWVSLGGQCRSAAIVPALVSPVVQG